MSMSINSISRIGSSGQVSAISAVKSGSNLSEDTIKKLKELGFFSGNPNGKFEIETEKAVQKYCKANGIYSRKTIDVNLQKHMGFELID